MEGEGEEQQGGGRGGASAAAAARNEARQKLDGEMLEAIIKQVVPRAVHLYLEGLEGGSASSRLSADGGGRGDDGEEAEEEDTEGFHMVDRTGGCGGGVSSLPPHSQMVLHAVKVGFTLNCLDWVHTQLPE